ncbi:hypothetical protein FEP99_05959 [Burkholderia pseudomultivorans]|nr:hypothetical protein [Burkholderia pseudomultivorans]
MFHVLVPSIVSATGSIRPVSVVRWVRNTLPVLDASETMSPVRLTAEALKVAWLPFDRSSSVPLPAVTIVPLRTAMSALPPRAANAGPLVDATLPPSTSTELVAPVASESEASTPAVAPLSVVPVSASVPPLSAVAPRPAALDIDEPVSAMRPPFCATRPSAAAPAVPIFVPDSSAVAPLPTTSAAAPAPAVATVVPPAASVESVPDTTMPRAPSPAVCTRVAASVEIRAPAPLDDRPSAPVPVVPICVPDSTIVVWVPKLSMPLPEPPTAIDVAPAAMPPSDTVESISTPSALPFAATVPAPDSATDAPAPVRWMPAMPSSASIEPVLVSVADAPCTSTPVPSDTRIVDALFTVPCVPTTTPVEPAPVSSTVLRLSSVPRFCATKPVTPAVDDVTAASLVSVVATGAPAFAPDRSCGWPSTTPAIAPAAFRLIVAPASIVPVAPPSTATAMPFAPLTL